jgi:hypothetical protein
MSTEISRSNVSSEFLQVQVSGNILLGSQGVKMAVIPANDILESADLASVSWASATPAYSNTARKSATTYAIGSWDIYVQVVSSPEVPVLYAGRMQVT